MVGYKHKIEPNGNILLSFTVGITKDVNDDKRIAQLVNLMLESQDQVGKFMLNDGVEDLGCELVGGVYVHKYRLKPDPNYVDMDRSPSLENTQNRILNSLAHYSGLIEGYSFPSE